MTEEVGQCPSHVGDTQGRDSYSWNTEKQQGSCFSCGLSTWLHEHTGALWGKRNGRKFIVSKANGEVLEETQEYTPKDIKEPQGTYEYRGLRGVTKDTMEKLDIRYYEDQEWVYLDKPSNKWVKGRSDELWSFTATGAIRKRRLDLDKDHPAAFTTVGSVDSFFAQGLFPAGCSKKVTVVEGPDFDLASAYQMMQNGNFINPVVSLPGSKPSGKFWENTKAWLDSFEEIIFSADNDEPGRKVAEVMFDLFPGKVYMMDHGQHKDANDFLMNGDARAYKNAWWKAKKYSPAGFTASVEDWFAAIEGEDPYEYTPTPIEAYNRIGKGLVKGGITVIKAPPGTGKSSYLRMLMHYLTTAQDKVVAALMMEEVKSVTGRAMATYQLGKNVKTKEDAAYSEVSEDAVKQALKTVLGEGGERFVSFDVNPQDPVEDTLKQCKHAITIYGAEYIFIDHLQRLAYLMGTDGATASLTELGVKLTELAKRRNVGIICISHVNSEGKTKYSGAIEEEAIVMIEMSRDKKSEDIQERNTTYLEITKNRPYALTGPAGMLEYSVETDMVAERLGPQEPKTGERDDF